MGKHCETCHTSKGLTRQRWGATFKRLPPDFVTGPFLWAPSALPAEVRLKRLAEIIKFGLAGTDMPGHEYLADNEIAAMAAYRINLAEQKLHESVANRR